MYTLLTVKRFTISIQFHIHTGIHKMIGIKELRESQKSEMFKLIAWVGSQSRLAKSLGIERQVVAGWVRRGRVSASAAIKIEQLTDGLFKKEALRPDVVCWEG